MAKKKNASRADQVRDAVDQAFTQIPRERFSELLDELGNTAGRLKGAVDELRPATEAEIKALRSDIEALTARVAALETAAKPAAPRRRAPAAATPAARKPAATTRARKPAGNPPAAGS